MQHRTLYLGPNNADRGRTLYFFALHLRSINSNPFQSARSCKGRHDPKLVAFLNSLLFHQRNVEKRYLELFFQSCLSSYSWYEDAVHIAMQLIWRYFSLFSKNGFQQGIVDENVLLLTGTIYGSHWAGPLRGSHLYPIPKIHLGWALPVAGTSPWISSSITPIWVAPILTCLSIVT